MHPIHEVVAIGAECAKCEWTIWTTPSSGVPSHNGSTRTNQTHIQIYILQLRYNPSFIPFQIRIRIPFRFLCSSRFLRCTGSTGSCSGDLMIRWCNPLFPLLNLKWNWDWYYVVTVPEINQLHIHSIDWIAVCWNASKAAFSPQE